MLNFTNPTGGTADREKLEKLAKFAVDKDLVSSAMKSTKHLKVSISV